MTPRGKSNVQEWDPNTGTPSLTDVEAWAVVYADARDKGLYWKRAEIEALERAYDKLMTAANRYERSRSDAPL